MAPRRRRTDRDLAKRHRVTLESSFGPSNKTIRQMIALVRASGVVPALEQVMGRRRDAEERTSIRLVVVASLINAARENHHGRVLAVAQVIQSLPSTVRALLGSPHWTETGGYDRVQRLITRIAAILDEGAWITDPGTGDSHLIDFAWYTDALLHALIPPELIKNAGIAVDGTAMETFGKLHTDPKTIPLEGDYRQDDPDAIKHQNTAEEAAARQTEKKEERKRAKIFGIGDDGRKIYTKDRDARAGWRTATNGEPSGFYIGRELHLGTAIRRIQSTDRVRQATFGPEVPQLILFASLTPAGTHRAKTVLPHLLDLHDQGIIHDVVADPGYTLAKKELFHLPLQQAGIPLTLRPVTHQTKPILRDKALVLDGQLFSIYTPDDLRKLSAPPRGASEEERKRYIAEFERRSKYRFSYHADAGNGATRYADPFRSRKLRSRQIPSTMRRNRSLPLIDLPDGFDLADVNCTITVGADALPLEQPTIYGTTAWNEAWGRRNLVETANSRLKGGHADIRRGYTNHLDTGRILFHLSATLANFNFIILTNWNTRPRFDQPRQPRKDRAARWTDLNLAPKPASSHPPA